MARTHARRPEDGEPRRGAAALKRLLTEIRGCQICRASLPVAPRPILMAHPEARLLIAGQAPGSRAHATQSPWNDASGDTLREWLGIDHRVFYDARQVAMVPMGFCYPGRGKHGDLPPRPECAAHWHARLLAGLSGIRTTIVIGAYAQHYHLNTEKSDSVTDTVRRWRDYAPRHVPLPHPSPRNRIWLRRNSWFAAELLPALREIVARALPG